MGDSRYTWPGDEDEARAIVHAAPPLHLTIAIEIGEQPDAPLGVALELNAPEMRSRGGLDVEPTALADRREILEGLLEAPAWMRNAQGMQTRARIASLVAEPAGGRTSWTLEQTWSFDTHPAAWGAP